MEGCLDSSLRTLIFGENRLKFNKFVKKSHNGLAVNCAVLIRWDKPSTAELSAKPCGIKNILEEKLCHRQ